MHDLAELLSRLEPGIRLGAPFQRDHRVDRRAADRPRWPPPSSPGTRPEVPMVEPSRLHWNQKRRRRSSGHLRPGGGAAGHQPAAGAEGSERSLPGRFAHRVHHDVGADLPSGSEPRPGHVLRRVVEARSAPSARARASLASDELVTTTRAPRCLAIWSAAIATPPPIPQISTVSPAAEAGPGYEHPPGGEGRQRQRRRLRPAETGPTLATFRAGTTRYSAAVPGKCSPITPNDAAVGLLARPAERAVRRTSGRG